MSSILHCNFKDMVQDHLGQATAPPNVLGGFHLRQKIYGGHYNMLCTEHKSLLSSFPKEISTPQARK